MGRAQVLDTGEEDGWDEWSACGLVFFFCPVSHFWRLVNRRSKDMIYIFIHRNAKK
jgi:hypothetical protein